MLTPEAKIRMLKHLAALALFALAGSAQAQPWDNNRIAEMLVSELSPTGAMEGGQWFVSAQLLTPGTLGLGIIYAYVPGSAGTVSIHAALFRWAEDGWTKSTNIGGLFGYEPKDVAFFVDRVEVSTLTLGPNDPRCCPTLAKRWAIDLQSGLAVPIN
jgi:hypothetical protein